MSVSIILIKKGPPHFLPGDTISGSVVAEMDQRKPCESIVLEFQGKAVVAISETNKDGVTKIFRAEEVYINESRTLVQIDVIHRGTTEFPFHFKLPHNIPCSFVATHGFVKYSMAVLMKCLSPNLEVHSSLDIIVKGFLDLNKYPILPDFGPTEVTHQLTGGWCCFSCKRSITAQLTLPRRAFVPGHFIAFQILIDNNSCSDLMSYIVQLVMTATCRAEGAETSRHEVFDQMAGPVVTRKTCHMWDVENFDIPVIQPLGLPPTGLGASCRIIDVQYTFKVLLVVEQGCCDGGLTFSVPVLLGTVDLDQ